MKYLYIIIILALSINLFSDIDFAKKLYNDGLYEEAINEFKKVVQEAPASKTAAEATLYIADSYIQQNNYEKAISYLKKIIRGYTDFSKMDEVLFKTATAYFTMKDYDSAINYFKKLMSKYPRSKYSEKSLIPYAESFYNTTQYQDTIILIEKLIKNYPANPDIPSLKFLLAKSYEKDNIKDKALEILKQIIKKYPSTNERWEAEKYIITMQEEEKGVKNSISQIEKILKKPNLPRKYEELFLFLAAQKYMSLKDYINAEKKLEKLLSKFENSDNRDKYILEYMKTNIKLKKYAANTSLYEKDIKLISSSNITDKISFLAAKSFMETGKLDRSDEIITQISKTSQNDTLLLGNGLLKSELLKKQNKFIPAIKNYLLYAEKYPKLGKTGEIHYKIAEIHMNNLKNYEKAIEEYMKISAYDKNYLNARYKIAICYENLKKYDEAVKILQNINKSDEKATTINAKLDYLKNFKVKNYKTAFEKLLASMINYQTSKNDSLFKTNLIRIYADDLKEYKNALTLISNNDYLKCKILLKLMQKSKAEGGDYHKYETQFDNALQNLHGSELSELTIDKKDFEKNDLSKLTEMMEKHISSFPNSKATNRFKLRLAKYYIDKKDFEKAEKYITTLSKNDNMDFDEYYTLKLALAENYYKNNQNEKALSYYKEALTKINLRNPEIFFHYCVVLYETQKSSTAIEKLKFLVNNTDFFAGKQTVYSYLAKILRENKDIKNAIKYQLMIPENYRNDTFYKTLALDYNAMGNKENAKNMILRIKNKDRTTLELLANLQRETGDISMAIYTLEKLSSSKKPIYYKELGNLYFQTKNYKKAITDFNAYLQHQQNIDDKNIVIRLIKSYLEIKNRPKADEIKKTYKKILDKNDKSQITLYYGIYYLDFDIESAIKKFSSLIKNKKTNEAIKYEAHFWRGLAYIKQKKNDFALTDFNIALKTKDTELLKNIHLKLGTLYFTKEDYENALKNYLYVIENAGDEKIAFDAAKNFALVCKTTNEWQKAIEMYNLINERWGKDNIKVKAQNLFDIGFCYFRDKKYSKAIDYFREALTVLDEKEILAETQYWIGESYYGMENYNQAIAEYLKVSYNYPSQTRWAASAQLKAADSYLKIDKPDRAKQLFNRIIKKYGAHSQWGEQAKKYLEKI